MLPKIPELGSSMTWDDYDRQTMSQEEATELKVVKPTDPFITGTIPDDTQFSEKKG